MRGRIAVWGVVLRYLRIRSDRSVETSDRSVACFDKSVGFDIPVVLHNACNGIDRCLAGGEERADLRDLRTFVAFLGEEPTIADVTLENIERFQADRAHLAGSTMAKYLSIVRSYCRYCIRKKLRADDPTLEIEEWPPREEPPPRALSARELRLLDLALATPLEQLPVWRRATRARDRIAVLLMLSAGLRLSETAALLWKESISMC